jgi:hypothetical protein
MSSPQSIFGKDYKANISDPAVKNRLEFGGSGVFYVDSSNPFSKSPIQQQTILQGSVFYDAANDLTIVPFVGVPDVSLVPNNKRCFLTINTGDIRQYGIVAASAGSVSIEGDQTADIAKATADIANLYYAYKGAVVQFIETSTIDAISESNVVGLVDCTGKTFLAGSFMYCEFDSISLTSGFAKVFLY